MEPFRDPPVVAVAAFLCDCLESNTDSHPICHGGSFTLAAPRGGPCPRPAQRFILRHGSPFPARKPGGPTFRLCAIGGENLDRRFYLYNLSRTLSDDQHADERIAKAIGKNRCASGLVQRRSGKGYAGSFARLRREVTRRTKALGFSYWSEIRDLRPFSERLQACGLRWQ